MRRSTELSAYNRALAFGNRPDGDVMTNAALRGLAMNEAQMIYLLCAWSDNTDVGYAMHGLGKTGPAFALPTYEEVSYALKFMVR